MTEEEKQKLNEKLAKWAGFEYIPDWVEHPTMPAHWRRDNEWFMDANFTDSLDTCFKWLVPKLENGKYRMAITYNNIKRPNHEYTYRISLCKFKTNSLGKAYGKNPALALCLAIEKLIDEK